MTSHLAPLLAFRVNMLRSLAVSIGVGNSGTKAQVAAKIMKSCCERVGFFERSMGGDEKVRGKRGKGRGREVERGVRGQTEERKKRVLSIDMGIRNLGMCVIEVPNCGAVPGVVDKKRKTPRPRKKAETLPKIIAWERIAIAERPSKASETPETPVAQVAQADIVTPKKSKPKTPDPSPDKSIYPLPPTPGTDTTTSKKGKRKTPNPDFAETITPLPQTPETDVSTPKKGRRKNPNPGSDESISPLPSASGTDTTTPKKDRRETPSPVFQETIPSLSQTPETDVTTTKRGKRKTSKPDPHKKTTPLPVKTPKARKKKTESFEPADYAILATNFVRTVLPRFSPDAILIESQHYRTRGSSAVQEWTIRVNMFEAMLHAVFYALGDQRRGKSTRRKSPVAESVLPARVNMFWIDKVGEKYLEVKKTPRRKKRDSEPGKENLDEGVDTKVKEKKTKAKMKLAKISLVSEWIKRGDVVSFSQEVASIASDFIPPERMGRKRPPMKVGAGKLDDLADCLLQGMAWIRWEENRRGLAEGRLIPGLWPCGKKDS